MKHKIGFLVPNGTDMLDLTGPMDVFVHANTIAKAPHYEIELLGRGRRATFHGGLVIQTTTTLDDFAKRPLDTILALGCPPPSEENTHLANWLRARAGSVGRIGSVCTGAFVLAEAGLLRGRRATTHWSYTRLLQQRYPRMEVEPDAIFVRDGPIWTSAGITAGVDMALALVEEDLGHQVALSVAQRLVLFLRRPGGQSQFSAALSLAASSRPRLKELVAWLPANLTEDLSVQALAARAGMSRRNFTRAFSQEIGEPPGSYIETLRLNAARHLLETSDLGLDEVAVQCGMERAANLRRIFLRRLKINGKAYRARFAARDRLTARGVSITS